MENIYALHAFPEQLKWLQYVTTVRHGSTYILIDAEDVPEYQIISREEAEARLPVPLDEILSMPTTTDILAR